MLRGTILVLLDSDLSPGERAKLGIKDNLIRFSFGVEDFEDVKSDILQALKAV